MLSINIILLLSTLVCLLLICAVSLASLCYLSMKSNVTAKMYMKYLFIPFGILTFLCFLIFKSVSIVDNAKKSLFISNYTELQDCTLEVSNIPRDAVIGDFSSNTLWDNGVRGFNVEDDGLVSFKYMLGYPSDEFEQVLENLNLHK